MSKRMSLQPLPRRLSAENTAQPALTKDKLGSAPLLADGHVAAKPSTTSPLLKKTSLIEPRRIALKYSSQSLVLEYKDQATGKLRHRSFRIDIDRFETAAQCERKLWGRLKKAIVPGSLQPAQVSKLVAQLFEHEKQQNPDDSELEAATEKFMVMQAEDPKPMPARTSTGVKPSPLASQQIKPAHMREESKSEKQEHGASGVRSVGIEGDKENSPNVDIAPERGAGGAHPPALNASSTTATSADEGEAGDEKEGAHDDNELHKSAEGSVAKKLEPLPSVVLSAGGSGLLNLPKLPGMLGGGGAVAGRRAGLAPVGGSSGGFGSLTADVGGAGDDEDEESLGSSAVMLAGVHASKADGRASVASMRASLGLPESSKEEEKEEEDEFDEASEALGAGARHARAGAGEDVGTSGGAEKGRGYRGVEAASPRRGVELESPVSATSSKGEAFLGMGGGDVAGGSHKKAMVEKGEGKGDETEVAQVGAVDESVEVELEEEILEEEDMPDYADDFEDDFEEEEEEEDLSLPLPGSEKKQTSTGSEEGTRAADAAEREEREEQERLRIRGDDLDLQRIEEAELERYKRQMEEEFEKNAIKPGDPNWVHDKQVDFGDAEEDCGWDEEEDDDAF